MNEDEKRARLREWHLAELEALICKYEIVVESSDLREWAEKLKREAESLRE